jgi:hypothetical protein
MYNEYKVELENAVEDKVGSLVDNVKRTNATPQRVTTVNAFLEGMDVMYEERVCISSKLTSYQSQNGRRLSFGARAPAKYDTRLVGASCKCSG